MHTYTESEAQNRFGELLDQLQQGPVRVLRQGQEAGFLISAEDYEIVRKARVERLLQTLQQSAERAEANGMTEEILQELLKDES